jgi:hypothetical protein
MENLSANKSPPSGTPSLPVSSLPASNLPTSAPLSASPSAPRIHSADADRIAHPNIEFQPSYTGNLDNMFELLKYEMRRKMTRSDVLRLVNAHLKQVAVIFEDEFNMLRAQLMVQATAKRHYDRLGAEASIMSSSSSVGASVAESGSLNAHQHSTHKRIFRGGMQAGNGGPAARGPPSVKQLGPFRGGKRKGEVPQTYSPRQNQLVLASYPNGRGGALRPLHRQIGGRLEHQVDLALQAPAKHRNGR